MMLRFGGILATSVGTFISACGSPVAPQTAGATSNVKVEFDGLSQVYGPYKDLIEKKVPPSAFDQGCHRIEGSGEEQREVVLGRGDGRATVCEAIEAVLARHRQYPEHADRVAGTSLSLSLEAKGELAAFAHSVRERIDRIHTRLTAEIDAVGVKSGSFEYEIRRTLGLFLFAVASRDPVKMQSERSRLWPLLQELDNLGMHGFVEYLMQDEGGLGIDEMVWLPLDRGMTSPLQALRDRRGTALHKVSLLYAVFDYAGMKVQFAKAPLQSILPYLRKKKIAVLYSSREADYFYVAVDVGGSRPRYLDPNMLQTDEYKQTTRLSLRYYSAYRAIEYGNYAFLDKDFRSALMFFEQSVWLVPDQADAYFNIGNTYLLTNQFASAIAAYKKALRYNAHHSSALSNLAVASYLNGERDQVEALILRAIDSDPENFNAVQNYISILIEQGRFDEAVNFLQKVMKTYPLIYQYRQLLEQLKRYQNATP